MSQSYAAGPGQPDCVSFQQIVKAAKQLKTQISSPKAKDISNEDDAENGFEDHWTNQVRFGDRAVFVQIRF